MFPSTMCLLVATDTGRAQVYIYNHAVAIQESDPYICLQPHTFLGLQQTVFLPVRAAQHIGDETGGMDEPDSLIAASRAL